jgi:hypothetical protein
MDESGHVDSGIEKLVCNVEILLSVLTNRVYDTFCPTPHSNKPITDYRNAI